jgi:thiopeptide-type bacteriocin biosynthesis protein
VRLRIPLHTTTFTDAARNLAEWAEQLHTDGILSDYALHTYRPETRHGTGPTLAAAEAVFAADSAAALQRLSGDRQAATAAGMIAIADAFTGGNGLRWLAEHVPRRSGPRLEAAQLALARAPYGSDDLSAALTTYRSLADRDGLDTDQVLAGLLHLHHGRMIGVDTASERHCLRLARAVAHTDLARRSS